ncbi:MAG: T9SS type A sorting domain-containing protein [Ignavibacteria bacterium]|nr:T9SS type A sorting domain-containing protein [Ignavibacteria bacterium]
MSVYSSLAEAQTSASAILAVDQTSFMDGQGVAQPPGGPVTSIRNWQGDAFDVLRVRMVDAGSGDKLPTVLSRLVVRAAPGNTADWTMTFAGASLFDGTNALPMQSVRVLSDRLELAPRVPEAYVLDASDAVWTLRVHFRNDGVLVEGVQFCFEVNSNTDATAAAGASSAFSVSAGMALRSNVFSVGVTATQLAFTVLPRTVTTGKPFPATVAASDGFGNIASSFSGNVSIAVESGAGTLSTANPVQNAVLGIVRWTDLRYSATGPFRLAASVAGLGSFRSPEINAGSAADIVWTPTGSFVYQRYYHTATLLPSGSVFSTGGRDGHLALNTCEMFDPAGDMGRGSWIAKSSMSSQRERHTATRMPYGRIIVAGGLDDIPIRRCEMYDWQLDRWGPVEDMIDVRYEHTATLLRDGRLLVVGSKNYDKGFTGCEIFYLPMVHGGTGPLSAPTAGQWRSTGSLHVGRGKHTSTMLPDGRVLVTGGVSNYVPVRSCEIYDPSTEAWTTVASMQVAREGHTATLLSDGRVMVTGGAGYEETSCEVFDPATNGGQGSWFLLAPMKMGRRNHGAALMKDGILLVTGAWVMGQGAQSCEVFETSSPASSVWKLVSPMNWERSNHTLTSLADGRVLAAGGEVFGNQSGTSACEIGELQYVVGMQETPLPSGLALDAAYPNPFGARTRLRVSTDHGQALDIAVYSVLGARVRVLHAGRMEGGRHTLEWDGRDDAGKAAAPGMYFVRMIDERGGMKQTGGRVVALRSAYICSTMPAAHFPSASS